MFDLIATVENGLKFKKHKKLNGKVKLKNRLINQVLCQLRQKVVLVVKYVQYKQYQRKLQNRFASTKYFVEKIKEIKSEDNSQSAFDVQMLNKKQIEDPDVEPLLNESIDFIGPLSPMSIVSFDFDPEAFLLDQIAEKLNENLHQTQDSYTQTTPVVQITTETQTQSFLQPTERKNLLRTEDSFTQTTIEPAETTENKPNETLTSKLSELNRVTKWQRRYIKKQKYLYEKRYEDLRNKQNWYPNPYHLQKLFQLSCPCNKYPRKKMLKKCFGASSSDDDSSENNSSHIDPKNKLSKILSENSVINSTKVNSLKRTGTGLSKVSTKRSRIEPTVEDTNQDKILKRKVPKIHSGKATALDIEICDPTKPTQKIPSVEMLNEPPEKTKQEFLHLSPIKKLLSPLSPVKKSRVASTPISPKQTQNEFEATQDNSLKLTGAISSKVCRFEPKLKKTNRTEKPEVPEIIPTMDSDCIIEIFKLSKPTPTITSVKISNRPPVVVPEFETIQDNSFKHTGAISSKVIRFEPKPKKTNQTEKLEVPETIPAMDSDCNIEIFKPFKPTPTITSVNISNRAPVVVVARTNKDFLVFSPTKKLLSPLSPINKSRISSRPGVKRQMQNEFVKPTSEELPVLESVVDYTPAKHCRVSLTCLNPKKLRETPNELINSETDNENVVTKTVNGAVERKFKRPSFNLKSIKDIPTPELKGPGLDPGKCLELVCPKSELSCRPVEKKYPTNPGNSLPKTVDAELCLDSRTRNKELVPKNLIDTVERKFKRPSCRQPARNVTDFSIMRAKNVDAGKCLDAMSPNIEPRLNEERIPKNPDLDAGCGMEVVCSRSKVCYNELEFFDMHPISENAISSAGPVVKTDVVECNGKNNSNEECKIILDEFLHSDFEDEYLITAANKLANFQISTIVRELADLISEDQSTNVVYEFTPPAPPLTQIEQKIVALVGSMKPMQDRFLNKLHDRILKGDSLQVLSRYARVFSTMCRLRLDFKRARVFLCKIVYHLNHEAVPVVFTILKCWPDVLPPYKEGSVNLLAEVIVNVLLWKACPMRGFNRNALTDLLTKFYNYPRDQVPKIFSQTLLDKFNTSDNKLTRYAILIFAKSLQGLDLKQFVLNGLLSNINNCTNSKSDLDQIKMEYLAHRSLDLLLRVVWRANINEKAIVNEICGSIYRLNEKLGEAGIPDGMFKLQFRNGDQKSPSYNWDLTFT